MHIYMIIYQCVLTLIFVYTHTCINMHVRVHVHIHGNIHLRIHKHDHAHMNTCTCTHTWLCADVCFYMPTRTLICKCTYAHMHGCVHKHSVHMHMCTVPYVCIFIICVNTRHWNMHGHFHTNTHMCVYKTYMYVYHTHTHTCEYIIKWCVYKCMCV